MANDEWHQCHFCGTDVKDGYEDTAHTRRHWLSDCRPDLVPHEPGDLCTWPVSVYREWAGCYAYQDADGHVTLNHTHFYPDGAL